MTNHRHIPWSLLSLPAIRPAVRLLLFRIYAAVRGSATNTAIVTVNGNPTWRLDDYFYGGDEADNATVALLKELEIIAAHSNHYSAVTGSVFIAKTPEAFTYDDDGNLLSDGRWQYIWNGENRLIKAVELIAPTNRQPYTVEYAYDHRGRMVWKSVAPAIGSPIKTINYLWDDYNIIAENITDDSVTETTYNVWGLDLSGTLQGAGGVGGLLAVYSPLLLGEGQGEGGMALPCYDANGNITEYLSPDGTISVHYEYSPFGEIVIQSGTLAATFTHRFSTKPWCGVTGLNEYEYRKYSPSMGRWISRDPIGERGEINMIVFLKNRIITAIDLLGLKYYGLPATTEKCDDVAKIMAVSAVLAGPVSYKLWMHWLSGQGSVMELSMSSFDSLGTCRADALKQIKDLAPYFTSRGNDLFCNQSTILNGTVTETCVSINMMILNYTLTAKYENIITKSCDKNDCCKFINSKVAIHFIANDRTDFNPGSMFPAFPWHTIEDELINACFKFGDNDFDISATASSCLNLKGKCSQ